MSATDATCYEICEHLRQRYQELATAHGESGNIIGLFFHDLVIHFTGIIIHRAARYSYGDDFMFPWVNKTYAEEPFLYPSEKYPLLRAQKGLKALIKRRGILPVVAGHAVGFGYKQQVSSRKLLKLILHNPDIAEAYLPNLSSQKEYLKSVIDGLCKNYAIGNGAKVWENWNRYIVTNTTDVQRPIPHKGILLGTRQILHNRKLSLNYLQQGKEVVGFTHGEISEQVFSEPIFSYSDRTLCTTNIDYGDFNAKEMPHPVLFAPRQNLRRTSNVLASCYRPNNAIKGLDLSTSKVLFIPTIYQDNYLYGPGHGYESQIYYSWHLAVVRLIRNITIKVHPKTRWRPTYPCPVEDRYLEDCINEYEVLIFDFFATGAVLAIFSDKPVIYLDIGLRSFVAEFYKDLLNRCHVINIDISESWEEQIRSGLMQLELESKECTNTELSKYALCTTEKLSLGRLIYDVAMS